MTGDPIDVVLFDLGGVVVELGGVGALQELAGMVSSDAVWHRWLSSPWVREFERGGCSPAEFAVGVVSEWEIDITPDRFLEIFLRWPIGPFPGAPELLDEVRASVPIGCLSNTNTLHWEYQFSHWPVLQTFDFAFLSFQLGLVKPDAAIFEAVARQLPADPDRVLYLDDIAVNAEAARSFGFRSEQVRGVEEARGVLAALGLAAP